MDIAQRAQMTFREIAAHYADQYGHQCLVGSPATVADQLQTLFEETLARFPAMEFAGAPTFVESAFLNQPKTLPVRLS